MTMDGQYQSKVFDKKEIKFIEDWIADNIHHNKWQRNLDLHIDDISRRLDDKSAWVEAGLDLLKVASSTLSNTGYESEFIPIVFFDLFANSEVAGINFKTIHDMTDEFDLTPPALFIAPIDWTELHEAFDARNRKKADYLLGSNSDSLHCYYFEEMHDNGLEYVRNISVTIRDLSELSGSKKN